MSISASAQNFDMVFIGFIWHKHNERSNVTSEASPSTTYIFTDTSMQIFGNTMSWCKSVCSWHIVHQVPQDSASNRILVNLQHVVVSEKN